MYHIFNGFAFLVVTMFDIYVQWFHQLFLKFNNISKLNKTNVLVCRIIGCSLTFHHTQWRAHSNSYTDLDWTNCILNNLYTSITYIVLLDYAFCEYVMTSSLRYSSFKRTYITGDCESGELSTDGSFSRCSVFMPQRFTMEKSFGKIAIGSL